VRTYTARDCYVMGYSLRGSVSSVDAAQVVMVRQLPNNHRVETPWLLCQREVPGRRPLCWSYIVAVRQSGCVAGQLMSRAISCVAEGLGVAERGGWCRHLGASLLALGASLLAWHRHILYGEALTF
jgi:hypothetical protein